jgi:hypothetical protein
MTRRALWIALAEAAVGALGSIFVARQARDRATHLTSVSVGLASAQKGDARRAPDGRLEYFDGHSWSFSPLPPQDTPF